MINRAIRRHHRQRIKNKVKDYYAGAHKNNPRYLGIAINTQQPCSCYGCGNPRKHFKDVTKQEKIRTLDFELRAE